MDKREQERLIEVANRIRASIEEDVGDPYDDNYLTKGERLRRVRDEFIDNYIHIGTFLATMGGCAGIAWLMHNKVTIPGIQYLFQYVQNKIFIRDFLA